MSIKGKVQKFQAEAKRRVCEEIKQFLLPLVAESTMGSDTLHSVTPSSPTRDGYGSSTIEELQQRQRNEQITVTEELLVRNLHQVCACVC